MIGLALLVRPEQTSLVSAALLYTRMHVYAGMGVCICTVYMFMYMYICDTLFFHSIVSATN